MVPADRHVQTADPLGLRSEASARFERGFDPYMHRHAPSPASPNCSARRAPISSSTPAPSTPRAGRCHRRTAPTDVRVSAGQPDPRHLARRPTTFPRLLDPIGFTVPATATRVRSRCRRGDPTARMRSTSSRRSPATTATTASARRSRRRPCTAACRPTAATPPAAPGAARARDLRGDAEPVPRARRPADGRPRRRGDHDHQPARREESVLRTSLRPGLLKAIAFNESHRRSGAALFEIGHVYPPGEGGCPTSTRRSGVVLAGRRRRRRWRCGARSRRRSASAPASIRARAGRPARHTVGHAAGRQRSDGCGG